MRPKIMSDSELLRLSTEVVINEGPTVFTLRKIASHANVSPATLIKRFGSRDKLLAKCILYHLAKTEKSFKKNGLSFEEFFEQQSRDFKRDNVIQHISMLAQDMREPTLHKITKKYFEGFRKSLLVIVTNDNRFASVVDKEEFVLELEAIFHGAIIQGSFMNNFPIRQTVYNRLFSYVKTKCNVKIKK